MVQRTAAQIREELLVIRCQQGEEAAFTELVSLFQPRLLGHAFQLTGRPEAARDAVQETWLAIVSGMSRLDDPARFAGYAHRILVRRCADWTRRQQSRRKLASAVRSEAESAAPVTSDAAPPLSRLLNKLSTDRRTLLALHYVQGLSVRDIATLLRIPSGTVKSRLHHARKALERAMEKE